MTATTCAWLVRVPSNNPEPDSPEDCWREVECGEPVGSGRHALCVDHQAVMDMPDLEFEAVYERDDRGLIPGWS